MDALRDLDDALTMIHLFATLPAEQKYRIPNFAVETSRRLALEWQAYIVRSSSLRKIFISVKGFYYQAEVMGQTITWLVPHQLSQVWSVITATGVELSDNSLVSYNCFLPLPSIWTCANIPPKRRPVL